MIKVNTSRLKLLESSEFHLSVYAGDGHRFVALFRDCWNQIPAGDQRSIIDHWNQPRFQPSTTFELSDFWPDSDTAFAQVKSAGCGLLFHANSFEILPVKVALFVIAHELGHVLRWAQDKPHDEPEEVSEANANAIAAGWGFDDIAMRTFYKLVGLQGFEKACRSMTSGKMVK